MMSDSVAARSHLRADVPPASAPAPLLDRIEHVAAVVIPRPGALVTFEQMEMAERQIADGLAEMDDITAIEDTRDRLRAIEQYLRGKQMHLPALGAQRRLEARIGQLLGDAHVGRPANENVTMVPCRIINAQDPKRAAAVFDKINTSRKTPNAVEQFNVRVTADYDTEVHIHNIVERLGYRVTRGQGAGSIQSITALISIYKTFGSDVLKEALQAIKAAWGDDSNALAANIIKGYAALLAEHRGHIDFKRLRECMAKAMTPGQLIGKARYHSELTKASAADAVKHMIVQTYNAGLRTGKLGG